MTAVNPVVAEAPDYASEVLGDPWDFSNAADVAGPSDIAGGLLTFMPSGTVQPSLVASTASSQAWGRDGRVVPIDADRFNVISLRIWSSVYTQGGLSWTRCSWAQTPCRGWMSLGNLLPGWRTYSIRIGSAGLTTAPAQWGGQVEGLRLTGVTGSGATIKVDWARLTGDPMVWGATFKLQGDFSSSSLAVSWDTDADPSNNEDGGPGWGPFKNQEVTWSTTDRTVTVPVSTWPPGRYRIFVTVTGRTSELVLSAWVTLRPRPRPVMLTPNSLQGADYATTVRHNPWNMDQSADYTLRNARLVSANGRWIAADNTSNDPSVTLPVPKPFSGSTYHRVRITVALLGSYGLANAPGGGCVGRLLWTTASGGTAKWQTTDDLVLYPGWNTIDLDMATSPSSAITDPVLGAKRIGWAGQTITRLRFDPNEDPGERRWYVDDIRVSADPVSSGGRFDLKFADNSGLSGTTAKVEALGGGNRRYVVASGVAVAPGTNTVSWRPSPAVPPGLYRFQLTLTNSTGVVPQRGQQLVRIIPA
jgi:hypothetical protein